VEVTQARSYNPQSVQKSASKVPAPLRDALMFGDAVLLFSTNKQGVTRQSNQLLGTHSPDLALLSDLTLLELYRNNLTGSLPTEIGL
jgi:hypothetical protein